MHDDLGLMKLLVRPARSRNLTGAVVSAMKIVVQSDRDVLMPHLCVLYSRRGEWECAVRVVPSGSKDDGGRFQ